MASMLMISLHPQRPSDKQILIDSGTPGPRVQTPGLSIFRCTDTSRNWRTPSNQKIL